MAKSLFKVGGIASGAAFQVTDDAGTGKVSLDGAEVVLGAQQTNIPSYDITWTANKPTAGNTATIANGATPTVAESGQAIADLTAKVNALISALKAHGLLASF